MVILSLAEFFTVFGYFFAPILVLGLFCFGGIILSNRMGGKNKLLVFFVRVIIIGAAVVAFFYYFYWLLGAIAG